MTRPVKDTLRETAGDATSESDERVSPSLAVVDGDGKDGPADSGDDQVLARRVRAGDVAAFDQVFLEYSPALFEFAYRILRSSDDAQDIVQSVFRNVWEQRAKWTPTTSIRRYLLGATRNAAYNMARHARVVERAEAQLTREGRAPGMSAPAEPIESVVEAAELAARIEEAALELAPKCRTVFLTRWRHGRTVLETAHVLGLSPKTVEMQWTRALARIRERVKRFL